MATDVGELYVNLKLDIKNLEQGVKKAEKSLNKVASNTKKTNKNFQLLNNNMVRSIRRFETLIVAGTTLYKVWDNVIYAGVKLNQIYEDQALGISALVSAKVKMVDVNNQELDSYDKFVATQEMTKSVMDDIKRSALDTPASFSQMVGFYQQTIGHAITANGTFGTSIDEVNDNVLQFTKRMSALGSATGMEMPKINEEIRSLMSGNASTDSLLAMLLFGSPTEANKAVKEAKTRTDGLSTLLLEALKPFENVEGVQTYTKSIAQMGAAADDIRRGSMASLFEDMKDMANNIKDYLVGNMDEFVKKWQESYGEVRAFLIMSYDGFGKIFGSLGNIMDSVTSIFDGFEAWSSIIAVIKVSMNGLAQLMELMNLGLLQVKKYAQEAKNSLGLEQGGLTANQKKSLAHATKMRNLRDRNMDAWQNKIDKIMDSTNNVAVGETKVAKLQADILESKVRINELGEETYESVRKQSQALKDQYRLVTGIREAQNPAEVAKAVEIALAGANKDLEIQKKIGDVAAKRLRAMEAAAKVSGISLLGGSGDDPKADKAAAKALKKREDQISKMLDDLAKDWEDWINRFADTFVQVFDQAIHGDIMGAFANMFDNIGNTLMKPFVDDMASQMSKGLSSLVGGLGAAGSFGVGLLATGAGMLLDSFMSPDEQTPPVLDDMAATSDSMLNALDDIKDVQYPMLELTRNMTGYLETISLSFGGIENSLLRTGLDVGGDLFQDSYKSGTLFGGKSTSLYGTQLGVESATIAELMVGDIDAWFNQITKVVKTTWYGKDKTRYNNYFTDISGDISDYISNATAALFESLTLAGSTLGIDTGSSLLGGTGGLLDEVIDLGKIDTTGMSESEIAAELQGRFSAQMDGITEKYFSVVDEFQIAGEALGETLFRVLTNFDQVSYSLGLIGKSVDWRTANIIADIAGGLDALQSSLSSYTENFFSESEQFDMQMKTMQQSFRALNLVMPTTNEDFRALVESIDTTSDAGAALFAELIGLSDGFNEMTAAGKELSPVISEMASSVADAWLGNLSYLTLAQKAMYASGYFELARDSDGAINLVDAARLQAETALRSAQTEEEYKPAFDQYIEALEAAEIDADLDTVVNRLDILIEAVKDLEQAERNYA